MNCERARELIDLRVQEADAMSVATDTTAGATGDTITPVDRAALDAHVATCPACAAELAGLVEVRARLAQLASEKPNESEIDKMWQMAVSDVSGAGATVVATPKLRGARRAILDFAAATVGIAAVLAAAFVIGDWRFGNSLGGLFALENLRSMSSAARVYEADNASGLGIPVHPLQAANERPFMSLPGSEPSIDLNFDFTKYENISYGYQVPFGKANEDLALSGDGEIFATIAPNDSITTGQFLIQYDNTGDVVASAVASPVFASDANGNPIAGGNFLVGGDNESETPSYAMVAPTATMEGHSIGAAELDKLTSQLLDRHETASEARPRRERAAGRPAIRAPAEAPNLTEEMRRQLGGALAMAAPTAGGDSFQIERATPPPAAQPAPVSPPASAKIIKTGDLAVEVAEYEPAVQRVHAIVAEHGAYVADAQVQEATGGSLAGRIVVRCGPERFEALFAALKVVGRVESENVKAADVTAEYVDLEARIRGNKITEERLHDLVKNKTIVDKVTALLEVERELTRVRSVIEQLEGQLRVMADRVALSTIGVALREPQRTVPNASLSVEIGVLDEAAEALSAALAAHDGRLVRGETSKHGDGSRFGTYQMTVPLARFADLLTAIESLGRVAVRQVNDRQFGDVTAPWAQRVRCNVSLTLSEQIRQLPAGSLNIEVDGREDAVAKVSALLPEFDAAIVSNRTAQQSAAAQSAELQIRVPARRFAELVEALRALGRTVSRNVTGEAGAIIGGAAETPCDLTLTLSEMPREVPRGAMAVEVAGFEPARDALSRLIKDKGAQVLGSASQQRNDGTWIGQFRLGVAAGRMEEIVAGLEKLGRVAARSINGLGLSDLSRVDPDAQGVIEVTLAEKSTIAPAPDQASATIRGKLREALTGLYTSLGLIAYGLIVIAPWLVITLLLAWVVTCARRRRAAKA